MDVQTQPRGARFFSILNDSDCPSFAVHPRQSPQISIKTLIDPSPSPSQRVNRHERPALYRNGQYTRASSISSVGSNTPPLLRLSSSSSKSSSSSMDSSPSPVTPVYSFNDANGLPYDPMLRQDVVGYLPSPTTITPFLEQQMLIATPTAADVFAPKPLLPSVAPNQYPVGQFPLLVVPQQLPTPVSSIPSAPSTATSSVQPPPALPPPAAIRSKTSTTTAAPSTGKKNKYPCPYASSHRCQATFTTSGHAARHGKKHTGEKGVHCPICNKAFTRKDNMKQHERTHKSTNSGSNGDDSNARRSKAAVAKDAQRSKQIQQAETSRRSSIIRSPISEVTSLAHTSTEPSLNTEDSMPPVLYPDAPPMIMPMTIIPECISPNSTLYPPVTDELILMQQSTIPQVMVDKPIDFTLGGDMSTMPPLVRGYSDLDALAQAAETFNSYYPPPSNM